MKKMIIILVLLMPIFAHCQESYNKKTLPESLFAILSIKDEMDGSISLSVSKNLICFKNDKSIGFFITPVVRTDFSMEYFMLKSINIGTCDEAGEIQFLFEDGSNLKLTSFGDFNCSGDAAFQTEKETQNSLSTKNIKKIRYTNGRSGESFTYELLDMEKDYFKKVYSLLNEKKVVNYSE